MIHVVEPHADDAFLSLGGHIERWAKMGDEVVIVTVFSGTRKRAKDAAAYADAVRARWVGLGATEGEDVTQRIYDWVTSEGEHKYILPIAVAHSEHKEVRWAFEGSMTEYSRSIVRYYLDQPYASKTTNADAVTEACMGMRLKSWLKPHARKYRHIPLFKDQAKFFHFNPAETLKHTVEMILK